MESKALVSQLWMNWIRLEKNCPIIKRNWWVVIWNFDEPTTRQNIGPQGIHVPAYIYFNIVYR